MNLDQDRADGDDIATTIARRRRIPDIAPLALARSPTARLLLRLLGRAGLGIAPLRPSLIFLDAFDHERSPSARPCIDDAPRLARWCQLHGWRKLRLCCPV